MIKQHKKRLDRAEKCCAAFREYVAASVSDPFRDRMLNNAVEELLHWMKVAPKKVMYKTSIHTPPTQET